MCNAHTGADAHTRWDAGVGGLRCWVVEEAVD